MTLTETVRAQTRQAVAELLAAARMRAGAVSYTHLRAAYAHMADPVLVENIRAGAGIDIGGTLIGMHLRPVAVPVRLSLARIGEAGILCARTRPKYIGGSRAVYQTDELEVPR